MRTGSKMRPTPMTFRKAQWLRHTVQVLVLAFLLVAPVLSWYGNRLERGHVDRFLASEDHKIQHSVLVAVDERFRGDLTEVKDTHAQTQMVLDRLANLRGNTWSAEIGGVSITDPLAATESMVAGKALFPRVLIGLLIPVIATLLFGRFFCSWICPAGFIFEMHDKLRGLLTRLGLGLRTRNMTFKPSLKYVVLAVGLGMSFIVGLPLLSYIYPPATVAREVHGGVLRWLNGIDPSLANVAWFSVTAGTLFLLCILLVELFVSKRFWCRYVCPGGAIYGLLGAGRLVRVKRDPVTCTDCADCVKVCPMGLNPMKDKMGISCDNCLACVSSCPEKSLSLRLALPTKTTNQRGAEESPV